MRRSQFLLALLLSLGAAPAGAADEPPGTDSTPDEERVRYEYAVRAVGGAFDGMGVRGDSGGVAALELDLRPKIAAGSWRLDFPLRLDHRQTFGADLNETVVGAELDAVRKHSERMRYGPIGGLKYTRRADWPDLYQPDGAGGLLPTDRFTHLDWYVGWQHRYLLGAKRNLRWKARVTRSGYERDPAFNELDATPTHLVPRDNTQLKFDSSYRTIRDRVAYAVRFDAWYRWDSVAVARAAGTGTPTTDHQRLWGVEPSAELELRLAAVKVSLEYAWLSQVDAVTGYYSYAGHHPTAKIEATVGRSVAVALRADAWLLTYGPHSRTTTEDGRRLAYEKYSARAEARYGVTRTLAAVADLEWSKRTTNYCDYQAAPVGPCPASGYTIGWDYTNWMALAGVEWKP